MAGNVTYITNYLPKALYLYAVQYIRHSFNVLLVFVLLLSTVNTLVVKIAFEGNREYIVAELCVNRFNPQMKCNGKCYFMEQLEKEQESSEQPGRHLEESSIYWMVQVVENHASSAILPEASKKVALNAPLPSFDFTSSIFHPPIA